MINPENGKFVIELELDKDFVKEYEFLYNEYGPSMALLNGIHNSNLNFSDFIANFTAAESVAKSSTIDGSANSCTKDICTLENDMKKPHNKLLAFNKIFYEFKKFFGLDEAKKWLRNEWNGAAYLHDAYSATYKPYCFSYDLDKLVERGLFFITRFKTGPAKHLTTFNEHCLEYMSWLCNRSSGAVGLSSYLVYSWWFWNKDVKDNYYLVSPEYYRRQYFQKFIYACNEPYLRITECAFSNISIMDRCYLTELFGGREFPDGTFAIDHIEEILEHQKVFMEVVAEVRKQTMMTFPVLTYSLLFKNHKFVDEEFAHWCSDHNMEWNDSNFYTGSDVTSLSNCCFDARQQMTIRVDGNIYKGPFKLLYQTYSHRETIEVFYNGEWKPAKLTALKENHPIFHIITKEGREMYATEDHIHLTKGGEKKSHELKIGTKLKINTSTVDKIESNASGFDTITSIERVDQEGDWVFCVELTDTKQPYFTLTNGIKTHNCRLLSDTTKLDAFINSIGGTSLSVGSVKVNTINLHRIALESNRDEDQYIEILKDRINSCLNTLHIVRHIISRNIEKGLLPNYTHGLIELSKQYNTIGITAMYEVQDEFGYIITDEFGNKSYSDKAINFASRIMNVLNEEKEKYPCDYSINIECIPAERANIILCKKDMMLYPDMKPRFIYSNQWIPLMEKCTLQEKIRLGSILDKRCGGGQISHINLESQFTNKDQAWDALVHIADSGVIYFAFNITISVCKHEHAFYGDTCPICGEPVYDRFSRVVGFYTPVSAWSAERQTEYVQRYKYNQLTFDELLADSFSYSNGGFSICE